MQMPELTLGQAGGHLKHMLGAEGAYAAANAQVRCRRVASRISWRVESDPGDPGTRRIIAPRQDAQNLRPPSGRIGPLSAAPLCAGMAADSLSVKQSVRKLIR